MVLRGLLRYEEVRSAAAALFVAAIQYVLITKTTCTH